MAIYNYSLAVFRNTLGGYEAFVPAFPGLLIYNKNFGGVISKAKTLIENKIYDAGDAPDDVNQKLKDECYKGCDAWVSVGVDVDEYELNR